jgi:hypothetical protein
MSEWLKEHAWKVCISQKGIMGSNPILSACASPKLGYGGHCPQVVSEGGVFYFRPAGITKGNPIPNKSL